MKMITKINIYPMSRKNFRPGVWFLKSKILDDLVRATAFNKDRSTSTNGNWIESVSWRGEIVCSRNEREFRLNCKYR